VPFQRRIATLPVRQTREAEATSPTDTNQEVTTWIYIEELAKKRGKVLTLYQQGLRDEAIYVIEKSLELAEEYFGSDHATVADCLTGLAALLTEAGEYGPAEALYDRALLIRETLFGAAHLSVGTSLFNLALHSHYQGKYSDARSYYERSLAVKEQVLGLNHPDLASILEGYSGLLEQIGDSVGSRFAHDRAMEIKGESHHRTES